MLKAVKHFEFLNLSMAITLHREICPKISVDTNAYNLLVRIFAIRTECECDLPRECPM